MKRRTVLLSAAAAVAILGTVTVATARPGGWDGSPWGGPFGHMGRGGPMAGMVCNGDAQQRFVSMLDRAAARLTLTDAQKAKLNDAKAAIRDSRQAVQATCAKADFNQPPTTPAQRLERAEIAMTASLEALRSAKPAVTDFLNALTPDQQSQLRPSRCWR